MKLTLNSENICTPNSTGRRHNKNTDCQNSRSLFSTEVFPRRLPSCCSSSSTANLEQTEDDPKHAKMSTEVSILTKPTANGQLGAGGGDTGAFPSLIPSFADACKLVSAPYSCLVTDTHRRHIALSPMYLNKKRTGIQEELNTELLRYSETLKGVPLAYDDVSLLQQHGEIYDDNGYIHLDIQANFVIFQPQRGHKLLGIVNKLGVSHVGCLVHGCFNASVPKPAHVTIDTWREAGPRIGAELEFEVCQLDADTVGVLLIRGRLDRTRVQELMAAGESSDPTDPAEQLEEPDTEPALEPNQDSPDATVKPKKKKKKEKRREEVALVAAPGDAVHGTAEDSSTSSHTEERRKKKEKRQKEEDVEREVDERGPVELQGSDSSGYLSDKPNRKRKQGIDITPCLHGDPETPKTKKKKNK
ncbi:DNA-directed RNA polymerase I subunit RPA43 [Coregonus clupeaformis]|uniref:DNA-directed RNA polymerase I subunit RPA43 n=1 Tax=Coregonus clupeaformis TaxID=59861 RepID=UPI001E1C6761|nr:DNA-directed RNA polymerase I subunit RPA43 [Coregonus clupeaformis]